MTNTPNPLFGDDHVIGTDFWSTVKKKREFFDIMFRYIMVGINVADFSPRVDDLIQERKDLDILIKKTSRLKQKEIVNFLKLKREELYKNFHTHSMVFVDNGNTERKDNLKSGVTKAKPTPDRFNMDTMIKLKDYVTFVLQKHPSTEWNDLISAAFSAFIAYGSNEFPDSDVTEELIMKNLKAKGAAEGLSKKEKGLIKFIKKYEPGWKYPTDEVFKEEVLTPQLKEMELHDLVSYMMKNKTYRQYLKLFKNIDIWDAYKKKWIKGKLVDHNKHTGVCRVLMLKSIIEDGRRMEQYVIPTPHQFTRGQIRVRADKYDVYKALSERFNVNKSFMDENEFDFYNNVMTGLEPEWEKRFTKNRYRVGDFVVISAGGERDHSGKIDYISVNEDGDEIYWISYYERIPGGRLERKLLRGNYNKGEFVNYDAMSRMEVFDDATVFYKGLLDRANEMEEELKKLKGKKYDEYMVDYRKQLRKLALEEKKLEERKRRDENANIRRYLSKKSEKSADSGWEFYGAFAGLESKIPETKAKLKSFKNLQRYLNTIEEGDTKEVDFVKKLYGIRKKFKIYGVNINNTNLTVKNAMGSSPPKYVLKNKDIVMSYNTKKPNANMYNFMMAELLKSKVLIDTDELAWKTKVRKRIVKKENFWIWFEKTAAYVEFSSVDVDTYYPYTVTRYTRDVKTDSGDYNWLLTTLENDPLTKPISERETRTSTDMLNRKKMIIHIYKKTMYKVEPTIYPKEVIVIDFARRYMNNVIKHVNQKTKKTQDRLEAYKIKKAILSRHSLTSTMIGTSVNPKIKKKQIEEINSLLVHAHIGGLASSLGSLFQAAGQTVLKSAQTAAKFTGKAVVGAGKLAGKVAVGAGKFAGKVAVGAGKFAAKATKDVGRFAAKATKDVGRFTVKASKDVGRFATKATRNIGRFASKASRDIGRFSKAQIKVLGKQFQKLSVVKEKLAAAGENVKTFTSKLNNYRKQFGEKALNSLKDNYGKIKNFSQKELKKVSSAVKRYGARTVEKLKNPKFRELVENDPEILALSSQLDAQQDEFLRKEKEIKQKRTLPKPPTRSLPRRSVQIPQPLIGDVTPVEETEPVSLLQPIEQENSLERRRTQRFIAPSEEGSVYNINIGGTRYSGFGRSGGFDIKNLKTMRDNIM